MERLKDLSGFHVQNGLFFKREENGLITVAACESAQADARVIFKTAFPPSVFASVVADMSARGENGNTYAEALQFLTRI